MAVHTLRLGFSGMLGDGTLSGLEARLADMSGPMEEFGRSMMISVGRNFAEQGRPERWKPLAPSTAIRRGSGPILVDTGRLRASIGYRAGSHGLSVIARAGYAAIQQRGCRAGRYGRTVIPARPFLVLQEDDRRRLMSLLETYLMRR